MTSFVQNILVGSDRHKFVMTQNSQVAKGSDLYRVDKSTKLCMVVA